MKEKSIIENTVESLFDKMKCPYEKRGRLFELKAKEEQATFRYEIVADDEHANLVVIGHFPVPVPKTSRERMYKYISEQNNDNLVGVFVIDSDDGELTFRITNSVYGCTFDEEHVKYCIGLVSYTLSYKYEDIMKEMFCGPQVVFTFGGKENPDNQGKQV